MPNPFTQKGRKKVEYEDNRSDARVREEVGGVFDCQSCEEKVQGGIITTEGHLVWKCSQGHSSIIKEFA